MNICIVDMPVPILNPKSKSPIGLNAASYAEALMKQGHSVTVIHATNWKYRRNPQSYNTIQIPVLEHSSQLGKFLEEMFYSLRVANLILALHTKFQLIICFCYSAVFLTALESTLDRDLLKETVVTHAGLERKNSLIFETIGILIKRFGLRRSRLVVAASQVVKEKIIKLYHLDESSVVVLSASGVNMNAYESMDKSKARERLGLTEDMIMILCVGGIDRRKNQLTLVKAFNELVKYHKEARLFLIGPEIDRRYLDEIKQLVVDSGLESHVTLLGYLRDPEQVILYYNACDLFVLNSLAEGGLPRALLEAMSCARPCIASDIPDIREYAGDLALKLVNPLDYSALSSAILEILSNREEMLSMSRNGRLLANHFDWEYIASEMISLFHLHNTTGAN